MRVVTPIQNTLQFQDTFVVPFFTKIYQLSLTTQSPFGRRFTRSLYSAVVVCDLSRIPEILANSVKEGAGLDSDMTDDDDEMSSPVKKGKHRKNPSYRYHVF